MRVAAALASVVCSWVFLSSPAEAQQTSPATIPRVVRLTGTFVPANGQPAAPVETVTLSIYADEAGGSPMWEETQDVRVDSGGQYTVLLGASRPEGLPLSLFGSGDARWLSVRFERPGEDDRPRVRLTSVPYALRAVDAETLGGRPASAYALAEATEGTGATTTVTGPLAVNPGTPNFLSKYVSTADVGNSAVYETNGSVGIGTTVPLDTLHVRFSNTSGVFTGFAVQNLGATAGSFSGMLFYDQNGALGQFQGFNNSTH
jgi:trimeric autotransporter adhesin